MVLPMPLPLHSGAASGRTVRLGTCRLDITLAIGSLGMEHHAEVIEVVSQERKKQYTKRYRERHRDAIRIRERAWRYSHPEKMRVYAERKRRTTYVWHQRLKAEVLSHYSPRLVCQRCGFSDIRALSIDHIEGGGAKHFREIRSVGGGGFYQWLKRRNFPLGFQVLCMNCQWIKRSERGEVSHAGSRVLVK